MKYSITFLIAQLLITLNMQPLYAWGKTGHRVVAEIAEKRLNSETKNSVKKLLGTLSLAQISNWMDEIKSDDSWKHASPWHYVNIPDNSQYAVMEKSSEGDLVEALYYFTKVLADKKETKERQIIALKCLVHLMGDLHQPLHVGRKEDKGGNKIEVKWFGENKNLHQVWDEEMIDAEKLSYKEYATFLENELKVEASWSKGDLIDWINESYGLRKDIYKLDHEKLGYEYQFKNRELLHQQLFKAGVRLAAILNRIAQNSVIKPKYVQELSFKPGKSGI